MNRWFVFFNHYQTVFSFLLFIGYQRNMVGLSASLEQYTDLLVGIKGQADERLN